MNLPGKGILSLWNLRGSAQTTLKLGVIQCGGTILSPIAANSAGLPPGESVCIIPSRPGKLGK
jgi:hypothetical protein